MPSTWRKTLQTPRQPPARPAPPTPWAPGAIPRAAAGRPRGPPPPVAAAAQTMRADWGCRKGKRRRRRPLFAASAGGRRPPQKPPRGCTRVAGGVGNRTPSWGGRGGGRETHTASTEWGGEWKSGGVEGGTVVEGLVRRVEEQR
ncbi:hypothetical protein BU14_0200s0047 [Porphyra umbilicalis]|uniref:Uncharacterized protein n=1 Tax=Porphyra umbilicalis TaxID=2786 RepID=A0A1X6P5X7_PORUM|nr:hypothetical protein BU14_0200s0047 [Porphyra umbilicalis]|eukprot:OSX76292.1 hypothetical protein BU14_0200s0047 [Porphyra umbilicalis]